MYEKSKRSILIVDDDNKVLQSLSSWLKSEGFEVHAAAGSNEALKIMKSKNIDVTLLDYRMSKEDGITLAKRLMEIDENLKIIILTGFTSYESAVRAMKLGVYDYLSKSMPNDKILKVIKGAVREREADHIAREKDIFGKNAIKIVLFCDHSLIKERLESFSKNNAQFKLVKSFPEINHMKTKSVSQEIDIALICANCCLKTFKDAYVAFPELYRCFPGIKPVIINENFTDKEKVELLRLGVKGFSSRDLSSSLLEKALRRIKKGEVWVSRRVTNLALKGLMDYKATLQPKKEITGLTEREIEILKTMASGLKNRDIADKLFISEKTVKTHINRIFRKLGVNNRTRAILTAMEKKIFSSLDSDRLRETLKE
ncbi:MAG: response regulator [Candidatus Aminicenantes bacterium]|nr:response regulator [Candidatus Aminicenantes bacterium]